jgi:hypothetical protein
METRA